MSRSEPRNASAQLQFRSLPVNPTPAEFASAWSANFAGAVVAAAGAARVLSIEEARSIASRHGAEAVFSDDAVRAVTDKGLTELGLNQIMEAGRSYARVVAERVAGSDGTIRLGEGSAIPTEQIEAFERLRSRGLTRGVSELDGSD